MDIVKQQKGDAVEFKLQGRIDAYWSDHLTRSLEESVNAGTRHIQLQLSQVDYLSSAGIRVLLTINRQLKARDGGLVVTHPSESVLSVLTLAGLDQVFVVASSAPEELATQVEHRRWESATAIFNADDLSPGAKLSCHLVGDPRKLVEGGYDEDDARTVEFPAATFGLGLGAFGSNFAECRERVGEFLAVAGASGYLPNDGSNRPDCMVSEDEFVPQMNVLYGITGHGQFATRVRFEAKPVPPGVIALPELLTQCLDDAKAEMIGFVMLAECTSVVGASFKRSASPTDPNETLLSFPTDHVFERHLCVVVGVAASQPLPDWETVLDPVADGLDLTGHFHVVLFPNEPLPAGRPTLDTTVRQLFSQTSARNLLHLMHGDDSGQTEFVRGVCWFGPVDLPPAPEPKPAAAGSFGLRASPGH